MTMCPIRGLEKRKLHGFSHLGQVALLFLLFLSNVRADHKRSSKGEADRSEKTTGEIIAVLWRETVGTAHRHLRYGQGGQENLPPGTVFAFGQQELSGPKP